MCGLGSSLFSESQQNIHISRLADWIAGIDPSSLSTSIYDENNDCNCSISKDGILRIAGYFQQTVKYGNPLTKTFAVLVGFYLCPDIRNEVSATTSVIIATPYFTTFADRMHLYLCGDSHKTALLPLEIVLREWQFYMKLITR